jgi:hypothetical protein
MEERDDMQMHGLVGAIGRIRVRISISEITSRVMEDHCGGALMVTYVDGLSNVILRTDVIMGSRTAARKRVEQSLLDLWRDGDDFRLIVERGSSFGTSFRVVRQPRRIPRAG